MNLTGYEDHTMENPVIAVIIPAFNEELTIRETLINLHKELPNAWYYVIDNNSSDKTSEIANEILINLNCKGEVLFESRQGKGYAIRKAFQYVEADIYIMTDADNTYDSSNIHQMLEPILKKKCDLVVGDRLSNGNYHSENKRPFHSFGNNLVRNLINFFFKSRLKDIMSGYRVFTRRFVKNYPIMTSGFEIETEMTLHALDKRFHIIEHPVGYKDRITGSESKLNTFADGYRVLKLIFVLLKGYRPLFFFGIFSLIFSLLGLSMGAVVVYEYFLTNYIGRIPLAILSTGLMIFSLLFMTIGIVLHSMVNYHRLAYELQLNQYSNRKVR